MQHLETYIPATFQIILFIFITNTLHVYQLLLVKSVFIPAKQWQCVFVGFFFSIHVFACERLIMSPVCLSASEAREKRYRSTGAWGQMGCFNWNWVKNNPERIRVAQIPVSLQHRLWVRKCQGREEHSESPWHNLWDLWHERVPCCKHSALIYSDNI